MVGEFISKEIKIMKKGELLSKALLFATNAHHGQFDKSGKPYICHPLRVMYKLKTDDEELQCIALLHDVVEDCGITWEQLSDKGFTQRIIKGVSCMTKQNGETRQEYKNKVFSNRDAMLVKMQDLLHNSDLRRLKGVTEKDIERSIRYQIFYKEIEERLSNPQKYKLQNGKENQDGN